MSEQMDRLPGNRLRATLIDAKRVGLESKGRQRTSGRSGQVTYQVESSEEWDLIIPMPFQSNDVYYGFYLSIDFESIRDWPIAFPLKDVYINGTAEENKLQPGNPISFVTERWDDGPDSVWMEGILDLDMTRIEQSRTPRYRQHGFYRGTVTLYIKARLLSSTPGVIAVSVVPE